MAPLIAAKWDSGVATAIDLKVLLWSFVKCHRVLQVWKHILSWVRSEVLLSYIIYQPVLDGFLNQLILGILVGTFSVVRGKF